MGLKSAINNIKLKSAAEQKKLKKAIDNFITSFKPTYSVSAITYFVVPGIPVNKNVSKHDFGKGQYEEAREFYDKVVKKTKDLGLSPAEIHLVKGKKTILEQQQIGNVDAVQNMPMSVNS
jgi:hypothetical protein